jgi:Domain of unknown function (DUF4430)
MTLIRTLLVASLLALVLSTTAVAAPTAVDVRIEGKSSTIFNGPVITDGKVVTTDTGGSHLCDGSTATPPVGPGPTPNSALDDAALKGGFTWDGAWFGIDFFASRIAGESETPPNEFWGVFVNGAMLEVGGCQHILQAGDEVLWAYDAFSKLGGALRLTAPEATQTDQPIQVRVTKIAGGGAPVPGATVGGVTTGADGTATLEFDTPGIYPLTAEEPLHVRSREVRVCVDPPLVEACTSTDRTAPTAAIRAPGIASTLSRFGFVQLAWQGDDGSGSGVRRYRVQRRRLDVPSGAWRPVATDTRRTAARVPTRPGSSYEFQVQAIDRAGNASAPASATTLMPVDNLSHRLRFSDDGWRPLSRQGAFKLSVSRATERGASLAFRFTGTQATIVTRDLPRGGSLRLTVGGESKVVDLRGRGRFRSRLIATPRLERGRHVLRLTSLGDAPIEIDAIAVRP